MGILDWIDVGKVAAERDDNLHHYFYDAGLSRRLIDSNSSFLMLGRKGAGKTAVFLHMKENGALFKENDVRTTLALTNYSWNIHGLLSDETTVESLRYKDSWRFVIGVEVVRSLVQAYEQKDLKLPKPLREAGSVLEKIFSKPIPGWLDILGDKLLQLTKLRLPKGGLSPDTEGINIDVGEISFEQIKADNTLRTKLGKNLETLTNYIESAITDGLKDFRVFILFDKLDEAWTENSWEMCKDLNSGSIQAADYLPEKFKGRLRPIIFLREDIFETLSINDKNKLREDCGELLKWDRDSINNLLLKRINYYAKLNNVSQISELQELFDRKEVRSRTTPVNYINRCTFLRPRDAIAFYRKIIDAMKEDKGIYSEESSSSPSDFETIDQSEHLICNYIYRAEAAYSEWLLEELKDEWRSQRADLTSYFQCLGQIGKTIFSPDDFLGRLKELKIGNENNYMEILKFLYSISVIGFQIGDSKTWRFKAFYPTQGFSQANAYRVHFGLSQVLGLTESYS